MAKWKITTNLAVNADGPETIDAEYFKIDEDGRFIEFKTVDHKVVYMVATGHVVSVSRV